MSWYLDCIRQVRYLPISRFLVAALLSSSSFAASSSWVYFSFVSLLSLLVCCSTLSVLLAHSFFSLFCCLPFSRGLVISPNLCCCFDRLRGHCSSSSPQWMMLYCFSGRLCPQACVLGPSAFVGFYLRCLAHFLFPLFIFDVVCLFEAFHSYTFLAHPFFNLSF